jgi:glycosyltransferase involved in cell wall biosynthesis
MNDVSVVIPCHDHAGLLGRAVASCLAQDCLREVIIVDDQSSDASPEIGRTLAAENPRIRFVRMEQNAGPGAARNAGVQAAGSTLVCFLDADDELIGNYFPEVIQLMSRQPEMKAVKPDEEFLDPVKGYILPPYDPRYQAAVLSSVHGLVIDRATFLAMGGFPEAGVFRGPCGGEDVAFMQALIQHYQPIGRLGRCGYRTWTQSGSHLDRFLGNTRLTGDGFEFIRLHPDQQPDGALARGLASYHGEIDARLRRERQVSAG